MGSGRSHPPGPALAPAPEVSAPIFGPPGSSLSGSQNITGVCKEWEGRTTDSLPSPQGGSGAVGRSRRQNTFGVPEAPEQRVRVSQPQPSPSPRGSCLFLLLPPPLVAASRALLSREPVLSQLPRNLWRSGLWRRRRALPKHGRLTENQGACLLSDRVWGGARPGTMPRVNGKPSWLGRGCIVLGWHRFGQTQVKG